MLKPINDHIKIEVAHDAYGFSAQENEGVESGVVVDVPSELYFFGYHSFAFEQSFMATEQLAELLKVYQGLVGKRVFWSAFKERGSVIQEGDKKFAYLKLTDLVAVSDNAEVEAFVVNDTRSGGFKV